MRLALGQFDIRWEDKNYNKRKVESIILQSSKANADFILLPEMSLTGFSMNTNNLKEDRNGETIAWFKSQALQFNINIGFGYIESGVSMEKSKNNYAVIDNRGELISVYSKIHPFSFGRESLYYEGGANIALYKLQAWNIASFICYDLRFPEIFQIASKKTQLITVAANWPESRIHHWETLLKARAIENQCYIVGINRTGLGDNIKYSGASMVIDPLGAIVIKAGSDEELILCDIDINSFYNIRKEFKLKDDRRENLYCKLYNKTFGDDEN